VLKPVPIHTALALALACAALFAADPAEAQLMNPCPYTNDGDCDEPNGLGLCAWGTDVADCANPNSYFGQGSGYAGGGGGGGTGGGLMNPCPYTNDGDCDEPNGLGLCAWGTDVADCANPNSYFGQGSGYAGGGGGGVTGGGTGIAGGGGGGTYLLESYTAFLGWGDHYNSNGLRLTEPWQIIRQDRANYHRYGTGDPQDQWDSFFADYNNRAQAEQMLRNGYITPQARSAIVNGPVMIRVEIWGQGSTGTEIRVDVY